MSSARAFAFHCQQCAQCQNGLMCLEVAKGDALSSSSSAGSTASFVVPTSASASEFDVLFLGTGVSSGVPYLAHVVTGGNTCEVCLDALNVPGSKNKRNNVSIALLFNSAIDGSKQCVLVDVGKTMRTALLTEFPKRKITNVNAILLTHGHADAILGLDDVRDFQKYEVCEVIDPATNEKTLGTKMLTGPLPIYLHKETMDTVSKQFNYLTSKPKFLNEAEFIVERRIALLDFRVMDHNSEYSIQGLRIRQFPVYHGGDYVSLGYSFGREGEFVYISDVKIIPPDSMAYLQSIKKIKILVIDCLDLADGIFPHMGLDDCLKLIDILKPEKSYFTGMCCAVGMHEEADAVVGARSSTASLAYDGMYLEGLKM